MSDREWLRDANIDMSGVRIEPGRQIVVTYVGVVLPTSTPAMRLENGAVIQILDCGYITIPTGDDDD